MTKRLPIQELILRYVGRLLSRQGVGNSVQVDIQSIYRNVNRPKPSVRVALQRMVGHDTLDRKDRGVYIFTREGYSEYKYAMRAKETTSSNKKKHVWKKDNLDLEFTASGVVPDDLDVDHIDSVIRPMLVYDGMRWLWGIGVYVASEDLVFETDGGEKIGAVDKYNEDWVFEFKFVNRYADEYTDTEHRQILESHLRKGAKNEKTG